MGLKPRVTLLETPQETWIESPQAKRVPVAAQTSTRVERPVRGPGEQRLPVGEEYCPPTGEGIGDRTITGTVLQVMCECRPLVLKCGR